MNLNHKQCSNTIVAITKITRRITMHKTQEVILGKPFSTKGKTQQPFVILPREEPLSTENIDANYGRPQDKTLVHTSGCSMNKKAST
jgi:hypothetical protein